MDFELLADLAPDEQRAVLSTARRRRYESREVIFHEGDPGEAFHLIAKGRVVVRLSTPAGEVVSVAVLVAGQGFGEQALLSDDSLRTASAVALEPVETLTLSRHAFEELCTRSPRVQWVLLRQLAAQVRRLSQQLVDALHVPAERRVMRQALMLESIYGGELVTVTQEELATLAGTTRPTVNRTLRALMGEGIIRLRRGGFEVTDRAALARRAR